MIVSCSYCEAECETAPDRPRITVHCPLCGTITVVELAAARPSRFSLVLEVEPESAARLAEINETLRTLLSKVNAAMPSIAAPSRPSRAPWEWEYDFVCDESLESMRAAFNQSGPWQWELRDSAWYGDYLNTRPEEGIRVRIESYWEISHSDANWRSAQRSAVPFAERPSQFRLSVVGLSLRLQRAILRLTQLYRRIWWRLHFPRGRVGTELSTSWEKIGDHARGPLIAVRFGGVYPEGSKGLEFGRAMIEFLRFVLAETNPAGVIFDLTALDYVWGDTIGQLGMALLEKGKGFRPAAIAATGRTARALERLCEPHFLLGVAGVKLARNIEEARAQVERKLA